MEREPAKERTLSDPFQGSRESRRSGAPDGPRGDRKLVSLVGTPLHVEAHPWTGGLILWTQDPQGRWIRLPLRR